MLRRWAVYFEKLMNKRNEKETSLGDAERSEMQWVCKEEVSEKG